MASSVAGRRCCRALSKGISATKWLATQPMDSNSTSTLANTPRGPTGAAPVSVVADSDRVADRLDTDVSSPAGWRGRADEP
ncbi:hypothetical protein MSEO_39080 [Mycobacterium seoulense]|uniref:Uncharacterized protein n=1 Tax=Mycobacterium seoulense TaxID=386911 RepID=A0A7I7P3Y6_9MYCO|nr:hypothetical protein MSEO_39080 [Mycobacterium seoulense]